ncbi:MAG: glycosyltransferase N-terminal domain-containing protein [Bryobacteraceae bacterium]
MRTSFIFFLYRTIQTAALPLLFLYVLGRGLRTPRYFNRCAERFGRLPRSFSGTAAGGFWLHAVSVGEVLSSTELVRGLSGLGPVWISCSTLSGRDAAETKFGKLAQGVFYAPFDYVWAVRSVLRALRPSVIIVLETEIWPNLYREATRAGCGLILVNGRISDKTAEAYRSMRWFLHLYLHSRAILAQSDTDAALPGCGPLRSA